MKRGRQAKTITYVNLQKNMDAFKVSLLLYSIFLVHPKMGFGLINALKMVTMAKKWKTVPEMISCKLDWQNITRFVLTIAVFFAFVDKCEIFNTDGR